MKHIFVVNPAAGNGWGAKTIKQALHNYDGKYDYELYYTSSRLDATQFVKSRCEASPNELLRFYACGGDGTLNEVASGIAGFKNASMTCFACGSGNDFVKCVGGIDKYQDVGALLNAKEHEIDLMKVNNRYCINVFSFGLDTCAAKTMIAVKHKKIIGGKNAYFTGAIKALVTAMRTECHVVVDGESINDKEILLCTIANGTHVGGSFNCAPRSLHDDGLLDVCLCKVISRLKFLQMAVPYAKGRHLDDPRAKNIITYRRGNIIEVTAPEDFAATLDGEIVEGTYFRVEVLPKFIRFAIPE